MTSSSVAGGTGGAEGGAAGGVVSRGPGRTVTRSMEMGSGMPFRVTVTECSLADSTVWGPSAFVRNLECGISANFSAIVRADDGGRCINTVSPFLGLIENCTRLSKCCLYRACAAAVFSRAVSIIVRIRVRARFASTAEFVRSSHFRPKAEVPPGLIRPDLGRGPTRDSSADGGVRERRGQTRSYDGFVGCMRT